MIYQNKAAALVGQDGGGVMTSCFATDHYLTIALPVNASDLAAAIVGARFGLTDCMARLVCELAQIGGRVAQ